MLQYLRFGGLIAGAAVAFLVYSWGAQIITNYGQMAAQIERLQRDNTLILSRVDSYKTLLERRDAAIAASRCAEAIRAMIKNPDTIPRPSTPFVPGGGG